MAEYTNSIKESNLYKKIIDEKNIYNSIYSLESYVFEKNLLSKSDLEIYFRLTDKYDKDFIAQTIAICQKKLIQILTTDQLFDIQVYFKLKKYEDSEVTYRPIHSADLYTQICIVSLLNIIMFDDNYQNEKEKRSLSELSKLIPSNFYGNIPSTKMESLFVNWKGLYKKYSETVIDHYKLYKENGAYTHEVMLDLKDFFPSLNPMFIFSYVYKHLENTYKLPIDKECLKVLLIKLLYFNVNSKNFKIWAKQYYGLDDQKTKPFFNKGIPQGLPQSYFFGNLAMIVVADLEKQEFPGKGFYYVDDSVIYTKNIDEAQFKDRLEALNKECNKRLNSFISDDYRNNVLRCLNKKAQYIIKEYNLCFHEDGKSTIINIKGNDRNGYIRNIARQVSQVASTYNNISEEDDEVSYRKLEGLVELLNKELEGKKNNQNISDIKLLKRYKRYFLFRKRKLEFQRIGKVDEEFVKNFYERFQIEKQEDQINYEKLFNDFDEDIFAAESHLILSYYSNPDESKKIAIKLSGFERHVAKVLELENNNLYYSQTFKWSRYYNIQLAAVDRYKSLRLYMSQMNMTSVRKNNLDKYLRDKFDKFSIKDFLVFDINYSASDFVQKCSDEYNRKILNAYISSNLGVYASDSLTLYNQNPSRTLRYIDLRLLIFLRNKCFNITDFVAFAKKTFADKEEFGIGKIDNALFEVLPIFMKKVRSPQNIDKLILTHRLVSNLWMNGSKFLNAYTLHNEEHAITLICNCIHIVKNVDFFNLKQIDWFILFLVCYLHDISMVIHPDLDEFKLNTIKSDLISTKYQKRMIDILDSTGSINDDFKTMLVDIFQSVYQYFEDDVRSKHQKRSSLFIKEKSKTYLKFINESVLQIVADVSESHGYDAIDVYGRKSMAKDNLVSIKYLMILIRLADLMDMTKDRVNYYLLRSNINNLTSLSKFHWISHLITDQINISSKFKVNSDLDLSQHTIKETLIISIDIRDKYLAHTNCPANKCIGCNVDMDENDKLTIHIEDKNYYCNKDKKCNIICVWMQNKHKYLFDELVELKEYLSKVDNTLIKTDIDVVINYKDNIHLDPEFFDIVKEYLKIK